MATNMYRYSGKDAPAAGEPLAVPKQVERFARQITGYLQRPADIEKVGPDKWQIVVQAGSVWASAEVMRRAGKWKRSSGRYFVDGEERTPIGWGALKEALAEQDHPREDGLSPLVKIVDDIERAPLPVRVMFKKFSDQVAKNGSPFDVRAGKDAQGRWVVALDKQQEATGLRVPFNRGDVAAIQVVKEGQDVSGTVNNNLDAALRSVFSGSSGPQGDALEAQAGRPQGPVGNASSRKGTVMRN